MAKNNSASSKLENLRWSLDRKTSSFPLTNAKSERATLSSFEEEKEDEDAASELLLVLLLAKHSRHAFSWMRGGNMRTN